MIDHFKKLLFVHIPKNAGTSVERSIFDEFDFSLGYNKEYLFGFDPELHINLQHATLNQMLENQLISENKLKEYHSFTVVRNPFTRAVSGYTWLMRDRGINDTFANFLLKKGEFAESKLQEHPTYVLDHFFTQTEFIKVENEIQIKEILKFENLQKDFNMYMKKIGLNCKLESHFKKSKTKKSILIKLYTEKNLSIIREVYREDFENFDFSKKFNKLKFFIGYV